MRVVKEPFNFNTFLLPAFQKQAFDIIKDTDGVFLAGGAALAMYMNKPNHIRDFDVYTDDSIFDSGDTFIHKCSQIGFTAGTTQNERGWLVGLKKQDFEIQLISQYLGVRELIDTFDLSVSQMALYKNEFILSEKAFEDIRNMELNVLRYSKKSQLKNRIQKYEKKGFRVSSNFWNDFSNMIPTEPPYAY